MNGVHGVHKVDQSHTCKNWAIVLRVRTLEAAPVGGGRWVVLLTGAAVGGFGRFAA
jgi:hypothetical protein